MSILGILVVIVRVTEAGQGQLPDIAEAPDLLRFQFCTRECWQQQREENTDYCDNDEQFDQRECGFAA